MTMIRDPPKPPRGVVTWNVRIDPQLRARAKLLCHARGITPGHLVTLALAQHLGLNPADYAVTRPTGPRDTKGRWRLARDLERDVEAHE